MPSGRVRYWLCSADAKSHAPSRSIGGPEQDTSDDTTSTFTPIKEYFNGHAGDKFRAMVTASWVRNGSVEGWVKFRIEFYSVKWTVGIPSYVYTDACDGAAD